MRPARVLIVDDSAVMRALLSNILGEADGLEVVGVASDPFVAWEKIKALQPDVLTLDIEMPRMDGLSFLEKLMANAPMPVVMISAHTEGEGCHVTLRALELGAVDFVAKPRLDPVTGLVERARELVEKVTVATRARLQARSGPVRPISPAAALRPAPRIIAIGASTGGTEALREVLAALPADAPGVVIAQHMPERFTGPFAERLDRVCAMRVAEAVDGEPILPGRVLIARGDHHLEVRRSGAGFHAAVRRGPAVNRHRPSVDVLFTSCAEAAGADGIGLIMTGMGDDGARGLLAMRAQGAATFAQDEASCVVFGMPKAAIACGAVREVRPLGELAGAVMRAVVAA